MSNEKWVRDMNKAIDSSIKNLDEETSNNAPFIHKKVKRGIRFPSIGLRTLAVIVILSVTAYNLLSEYMKPPEGTGIPVTRVLRKVDGASAKIVKAHDIYKYPLAKSEYWPKDPDALILKITISSLDYYSRYEQDNRDYSKLKRNLIDNSGSVIYAVNRGLAFDRAHDQLYLCPEKEYNSDCMFVESKVKPGHQSVLFSGR